MAETLDEKMLQTQLQHVLDRDLTAQSSMQLIQSLFKNK